MSFRILIALLLIPVLFCPVLSAQRTWIVDRNNGPGTDFTDLPPAVAAAAAGDIIRIRPAPGLLYEAPAIIDNKPLSILGDHSTPPTIIGLIEVRNLPAGTTFRLAGLKHGTADIGQIFTRTLPYRGLRCQDNAGVIVLDRFEFGLDPTAPVGGYFSYGVLFERCAFVTVSRSTLWSSGNAITVRDSTLIATDSRFREWFPFIAPWGSSPETIFTQRSQLTLIDCEAIGTDGGWNPIQQVPLYPTPAILLCNATVSIGGRSQLWGGYFYGGGGRSSAILSNHQFFNFQCLGSPPISNLYLDPRSSAFGTPGTYALEHFDPVPGVRWGTTSAQSTLTTTQYTNPNSVTVLVAGSLLPSPVPGALGTTGTLFLDLATVFVVDIGVTGTLGEHTWSIPVPAGLPRPINLPIQAIELVQGGRLLLTNAVLPGIY